MASIVRVDQAKDLSGDDALTPLPVLLDIPGCHFANRCPVAMPVCHENRPPPVALADGHTVICHQFVEEAS